MSFRRRSTRPTPKARVTYWNRPASSSPAASRSSARTAGASPGSSTRRSANRCRTRIARWPRRSSSKSRSATRSRSPSGPTAAACLPALPDAPVRRGRDLTGAVNMLIDVTDEQSEALARAGRALPPPRGRALQPRKHRSCSSRWRPGSNRPPTTCGRKRRPKSSQQLELTVTSSPAAIPARQRTSFFTGRK